MIELSIEIDTKNEEEVLKILNEKNISISFAINELLKQIVTTDYIPLEMEEVEFSDKFLKILEEGEQILKDMEEGKIKGYQNIDKMFKDILNENCN